MSLAKCHCCCPVVGFDDVILWSRWFCCDGQTRLTNLLADVTQLTQCKVVFGGNYDSCGQAVRFAVGDWPTVKAYVVGGGRLWITAEWGNPTVMGHGLPLCFQDAAKTTLNSFLSSMGSTITYVGGDYVTGVFSDPGTANIAQGLSITSSLFGEITGGTSVWLSPAGAEGTGKAIVAVEKIGNGFLFVSGDSNLGLDNSTNFCDFVKRLWTYEDAAII